MIYSNAIRSKPKCTATSDPHHTRETAQPTALLPLLATDECYSQHWLAQWLQDGRPGFGAVVGGVWLTFTSTVTMVLVELCCPSPPYTHTHEKVRGGASSVSIPPHATGREANATRKHDHVVALAKRMRLPPLDASFETDK